MIYVMIVMLILGLVAGNALAAASHNATSEMNAVRQMKERYTAEGELNRQLAELEAKTGNFFQLPTGETELGAVSVASQMKTVSQNALKDSIGIISVESFAVDAVSVLLKSRVQLLPSVE